MLLKRLYKTIIGFVTCTVVVVVLMILIWPTIDFTNLIQMHDNLVVDYGGGAHFWVILLMLLVVNIFLPIRLPNPIPQLEGYDIYNQTGHVGLYVLILLIWLIGAFAGGLASRGGLRSGAWSAILSFLFLDFLFAIMTSATNASIVGLSGFSLFIVTFLFALVVGSFVFVPILGLVGGIAGGILGKMLFRKDKTKEEKDDKE